MFIQYDVIFHQLWQLYKAAVMQNNFDWSNIAYELRIYDHFSDATIFGNPRLGAHPSPKIDQSDLEISRLRIAKTFDS
jgi:hypothetical protein